MASVGIVGFSIFMIYSILFMLSPFIQSSQTLIPEQCNLKFGMHRNYFYLRLCRICIITGGSVFAGLIGCAMAAIRE